LTYGGQGTLKKGVHAESHAVIYTSKAPVMKPGERITKKSIKMDPFSPRDRLDPTSRINYAKLYTVEHDVKVHFVGKVFARHEQRVVTDYNGTHSPLAYRPYVPVNEEESMYADGRDSTDYDCLVVVKTNASFDTARRDTQTLAKNDASNSVPWDDSALLGLDTTRDPSQPAYEAAPSLDSSNGFYSFSFSSNYNIINGGERLFNILFKDVILYPLYAKALQKMSTQRFEDNFRRI